MKPNEQKVDKRDTTNYALYQKINLTKKEAKMLEEVFYLLEKHKDDHLTSLYFAAPLQRKARTLIFAKLYKKISQERTKLLSHQGFIIYAGSRKTVFPREISLTLCHILSFVLLHGIFATKATDPATLHYGKKTTNFFWDPITGHAIRYHLKSIDFQKIREAFVSYVNIN